MLRSTLITVFTSVLLLSCGGGPTTQPCPYTEGPPVPTSADPWYGVAGNVLVSDCGYDTDGIIDYLWVGFSSNTNWQELLNMNTLHPAGGFAICGQVVVLPSQPLGFYFNPDAMGAGDAIVQEAGTSIDQIKSNPAKFAGGPWCVQVKVEQVVASSY